MSNRTHIQQGSPLILASASPRRKILLAEAGYDFHICPSPLDEPNHIALNMPPSAHSEALAWFKAVSVKNLHPQATIVAADTIVAAGSEIIGKADDEAHAREILLKLSAAPHRVITSIAIISPGKPRLLVSAVTWVLMRRFARRELDDYIASGEWKGKAGAYGIQGLADKFVEKIEGSYSNVIGMPMELFTHLLPPGE